MDDFVDIEDRLQALLNQVLADLHNNERLGVVGIVHWKSMGEAQAYRNAIRQVRIAREEYNV